MLKYAMYSDVCVYDAITGTTLMNVLMIQQAVSFQKDSLMMCGEA